MGRDKATIDVGGETMAARVARALREVAGPVLVVGDESGTGLEAIDDPREGPLVAIATARAALRERTAGDGPVLVLACDLPFINAALLRFLLGEAAYPGADAVVPVRDGLDQSLCAWYAPRALDEAVRIAGSGARAMRDLLKGIAVRRIPQGEWQAVAHDTRALHDVDTPDDLRALMPD